MRRNGNFIVVNVFKEVQIILVKMTEMSIIEMVVFNLFGQQVDYHMILKRT